MRSFSKCLTTLLDGVELQNSRQWTTVALSPECTLEPETKQTNKKTISRASKPQVHLSRIEEGDPSCTRGLEPWHYGDRALIYIWVSWVHWAPVRMNDFLILIAWNTELSSASGYSWHLSLPHEILSHSAHSWR